MTISFQVLESVRIPASPPHRSSTEYCVERGIAKHNPASELWLPSMRVMIFQDGKPQHRYIPWYPVGTDDFKRVSEVITSMGGD